MRREIILAGKRLAYYYRRPSQEYWENLFLKQTSLSNAVNEVKHSEMFNIILKYIKKGFILDAGCGLAIYVKILHDMRFQVIGLDFSDKILEKVKKRMARITAYCSRC